MNQPIINDPRARFWGRMAKWSLVLIAGFFVAPYVWTAITGVLGLIAATVVIGGAWMLGKPAYSMAANLRLRLIKAEASRNPVETLQNEYQKEAENLERRKKAIEEMKASIMTAEDEAEKGAQRYPNDPRIAKLKRDIDTLYRIYEHRLALWRKAVADLRSFKEEIERASVIWKVAQAAAAAHESTGLSEDEFYSQIRKETAIDSVKTALNQSIASLDTAMEEIPQTEAITLPPSQSAQPTLTAPPPTIPLPSSAPSRSHDRTN